jgi:hypothetical protein
LSDDDLLAYEVAVRDRVKQVDEKLTLTKGSMEDWWLIERAEHDGREWIADGALMLSSRITNADIEGTGEEMLAIAKAIEDRSRFSALRCSVTVVDGRAELMSPRNSMYAASVTLAVADALAAEIRKVVA